MVVVSLNSLLSPLLRSLLWRLPRGLDNHHHRLPNLGVSIEENLEVSWVRDPGSSTQLGEVADHACPEWILVRSSQLFHGSDLGICRHRGIEIIEVVSENGIDVSVHSEESSGIDEGDISVKRALRSDFASDSIHTGTCWPRDEKCANGLGHE
jgi:hypothetical protein